MLGASFEEWKRLGNGFRIHLLVAFGLGTLMEWKKIVHCKQVNEGNALSGRRYA